MAKIYLSSTYSDLIAQRNAVYHALHRMCHDVWAMEDYVARDDRPLDACLKDVAECDIYIGIFAWRYGFIPPEGNPDQKSITELEYRKARELGKPRLIFLLAEDADCPPSRIDHFTGEGKNGKCIKTLRKELELERLISPFHNSEELATLVSAAVTNCEKSQTQDTARIALLNRTQYLKNVYEHYKSVKLPIGPADGIPLLAIFQPLKLRSDPLAAEDLEREQRRKLLGEDLSNDGEHLLRVSASSVTAENAEDALVKSPQKRIVVLGGPGTGKSTTLKHLAACAAEAALAVSDDDCATLPLPIFISLPDLARVNTGLQGYLPHIVDELKIDASFAHDLWGAINSGHAFVCLDSLDEVNPRLRGEIIERINTWTSDTHNTWIVGSRFTEYKGGQFRRGQFSEWELQSMDASMRHELAQRLLPMLQTRFSNVYSSTVMPATFVDLIEKHPQAAAWGENPLLFSLAAIVFVKTGTLPSSRTALYREIIEAVLKMHEYDPSERELLLRDFAALALWLHEKKGRTFTRSDLITFLKDEQQLSRSDITSIARRLVASGLMEVVAHETYGFRHQTFQEYLAAVELARRFASPDSLVKKEAWDFAWSKRTYSRWIEILRLLVGVLAKQYGPEGERQGQRWLCALVEQRETAEGDPGDLGLLLAVTSLSEIAGEGEEITAETERIAEKIVLIWVEEQLDIARKYNRYRFSALAYEISHLREYLHNVILSRLVMALSHPDGRMRAMAVYVLGEQVKRVPLEELRRMLEDEMGEVRAAAVESLGKQKESVFIEELRKMLEDKDGDVRAAAVRALGDQGERVSIEELRKILEDKDKDVRAAVVQVLGEQKGRVPIDDLKRLLWDRKWEVRYTTVNVLGDLEEKVPVEELIEMLDDKNGNVRVAAVRALGKLGERVPMEDLKRMLEDKDAGVRAAAVRALGKLKEKVPKEELRKMLDDKDGRVWPVVVEVLGKRGERVSKEELMRMLAGEDGNVRVTAVQVLRAQGKGVPMEVLRKLLDDGDRNVRAAAVRELGMIEGEMSKEELRKMLDDKCGEVRAAAVRELGIIGGWSKEELRKMLDDKCGEVRVAAVEILGKIGKNIFEFEGKLQNALQDKDENVRMAATKVLGGIEKGTSIAELRRKLWDEDGEVRAAAVWELRKRKRRVPKGKLKRMLDDKDSGVRVAVLFELFEWKREVPIGKLKRMLEDEDGYIRGVVVHLLGSQKRRVPIGRLRRMLGDEDDYVRAAVVRILGKQGERVPIENLRRMLEDKDENVRLVAVQALVKRGERAPIEELRKMLEDKDDNVRMAVVQALVKMGEKVPVEKLEEMLNDSRFYVRAAAVDVLGKRGERSLMEELRRMLRDEHRNVRAAVVRALGELKENISAELISTLGDEDSFVRYTAINMLKRNPEAFSIVTSEAQAILSGEPHGKILGSIQQYFVIIAVSNLGKVFPSLLEKLTPLLDWPNWLVRLEAVRTLGQVERNIPDAAIKRLLEMRLDPDPDMRLIREAADDALADILSLEGGIEDD